MGSYFSLLAFKDDNINKCLFLSPVVNMKIIIDNMMMLSNTTEKLLKEKQGKMVKNMNYKIKTIVKD